MTFEPTEASQISAISPDSDWHVEVCSPGNTDEWDQYVMAMPQGRLYHLAGWQGVFERSFGHSSFNLVARRSGRVAGVLPMTLVSSRLFGRILCSVPFLNYAGICSNDPGAAEILLRAAVSQANTLGVDYLELRSPEGLVTALPASLRKVSLTVDLHEEPDRLWSSFTSKHRNNIRRAQKLGLEVESGGAELLPEFFFVMQQSWRALGTPLYAYSFFADIMSTFGQCAKIFVCRKGATPVAAALNGYFKETVEGIWAGMGPECRALQANYALYWEMIQDACQRGYREYHLGRSTADSGGEQFKKKWNATAKQLYWHFYRPDGGPMPALNVENPRYRLAIRAWQRLPLSLLRVLGPKVAPYIP